MLVTAPDGSPEVLLHCCCAPCSGAIVECLVGSGIRPCIFFSNSNIFPRDEYELRKREIIRYAAQFGLEVVDDDYDHGAWNGCIKGRENDPERGRRCLECFKFRLLRAARYASEHGFTCITTTLASSRWKDLEQVDEAGKWACAQVEGVSWWGQNWRKGGLQPRRGEIIREQGFYNQTFCGCEWSRRVRCRIMGALNLTPDSFVASSRVSASDLPGRMLEMIDQGADIIDLGAVSTRPGAPEVSLEQEWERLSPALKAMPAGITVSVDTTRSEIIRRAVGTVGPVIVNDISAGLDDPSMLQTAASLGLQYVAMHKRGTPQTMDSLTDYGPCGVVQAEKDYFREFSRRALDAGIGDWILDPGFGFAKTDAQNVELLERLSEFKEFGRPILAGVADKRFTGGDTERFNALAAKGGAGILRVHDVAAARRTIDSLT